MGRRDQNRPPKKKTATAQDMADRLAESVLPFPTIENCNLDDPDEMALWALVGLPGQDGAPLPMPNKALRMVSRRLYNAGFRHHEEHRTIKYRPPQAGDANILTNPGSWMGIDDPDPDPAKLFGGLSREQKAEIRKKFGLDDDPADDRVPYVKADGSTVMVTPVQAARYNQAKKDRDAAKRRREAGK